MPHSPKDKVVHVLVWEAFSRNSVIDELARKFGASPASKGLEYQHYAMIAVDFFMQEKIEPLVDHLLPAFDKDRILMASELLAMIGKFRG